MKANYEEDKVIVSATEPTGVNRKKVWFKKGKNLINIKEVLPGTLNNNTGKYMNARSTIENITDNSVTFKLTSNWAGVVFFINVLPNTTYTLKFDSTIAEITGNVNDNYVLIDAFNNETYKRRIVQKSGTTHSFTTQENENEVRICIETGNTSALNINITLSNIQLEQGITATDYEPYIEKEIYVKNDNGAYEKYVFDDVTKINNIITEFYNNTNKKIKSSSVYISNGSNIDNMVESGIYYIMSTFGGTFPSGLGGNGCVVIVATTNTNYNAQLAFGFGSDKIAIRRRNGSTTWSDWKYANFS